MSSEKRLSDIYNNYLAPEAVIWIEDNKLSKEYVYFTNLEIDKTLDGYDTCTFLIPDSIDLEFNPKKTNLFELGDKIEVHIGYADSHKKKSDLSLLFKGFITNINWNFSEDNYLDISIEAKDYSFLLMKNEYTKSLKNITASEVLNKIISEVYSNLFNQKNRKIEDSSIKYEKIENDKENDYLFMKSLAQKNNFEFFIDNDSIYFRPIPEKLKSTLTLKYGEEILSFSPELNIEKEVTKVVVIGLELSKDKKKIVGEAPLSLGGFEDTSTGIKKLLKTVEYKVQESVKSTEEANARAAFLLKSFSNDSYKAEIKSIGIPDLKPGTTVSLTGMGKKFSRDYYIEKCVHSFNEQGYETTLLVVFKKDNYA